MLNGDGIECIDFESSTDDNTECYDKDFNAHDVCTEGTFERPNVIVQLDGNTGQFLTVTLLIHLQIGQQHHIQQHKSEHVTKILMNVL